MESDKNNLNKNMMENLVALTCPNCGATTTNHRNCEYCGSLLVRFVDKGISLSSEYTSNEKVHTGLIEALTENVELQKQFRNEMVVTDISKKISVKEVLTKNKSSSLASILSALATQDGKGIYFPDADYEKPHLMVAFGFNEQTSIADKQFHKRFKKLDVFNLFTCKEYNLNGNLIGLRYYEYAIDFGEDAEGAARLLSKILYEVYEIEYNDRDLEIITFHGENGKKLEKERLNNKAWYEKHLWTIIIGIIMLIVSK